MPGHWCRPRCSTYCPPGARIVDTAPMSLDAIVGGIRPRRTPPGRTSPGCIPATCRYGARWASSSAAWTGLGIPYTRDAGRALLRRCGRGAGSGADLAGPHPVAGADANLRPRLADAGAREAGWLRRDRRHAGHPSVDPRAGQGRGRVGSTLLADCPVAVVYRASWPDQRVVRGTLATIVAIRSAPASSAQR